MVQQNPYAPPVADAVAGAALSEGEYEFSEMENAVIKKAGERTRTWGIIPIATGVLALLAAVIVVGVGLPRFPGGLGALVGPAILAVVLPYGVVYLVMGKLYVDSGNALIDVVRTEGNDVELLMRGVDKMAS